MMPVLPVIAWLIRDDDHDQEEKAEVGTITIEIRDRDGKLSQVVFEGELMTPPVTTENDDKTRWVEFRLYRRNDGGYVVHRTGKSLIYHKLDTTCQTRGGSLRGYPARASSLPTDAEPCDWCNPPWPEDLAPDTQVRFEEDRDTITRVRTAGEVVHSLTWDAAAQKERWSRPVMDLVKAAAEVDEEFAAIPIGPIIKL